MIQLMRPLLTTYLFTSQRRVLSQNNIIRLLEKSQAREMSTKPKVLVTRADIPAAALDLLKEKCDVDLWPHSRPIEREALLNQIAGKDALFCLLTEKINTEVLNAAGLQLKVIGTMSVGFDHLELDEIKKRGIKVGYTPGVLTAATAELTLALTLATTRRLFEANQELINGGWAKCAWGPLWMCGLGINGSTVGIVGLGRIGEAVARLLKPFSPGKIIYSGRSPRPVGAELNAEFVPFDHLVAESDIVIITCALNDETRHMFSRTQFRAMKKTAVIINTSRGGLIDQDALIEALKTGEIAAAGLDVMTPEPLPTDHELTKLKNCVIIPHIGSATVQTRTEMATLTARNIISALEGTAMPAQLC